jgi:transketolase/transaldolase
VIPDATRLRPVRAHLRKSHGRAGFVSFEVAPRLAHDAEGTVADAKRLWALIGRPNAMIKIPATPAGIAALEEVIYAGINVNMTLIFSASQIQAVRAAHRRGLARRLQDKLSVQRIASVASVFISRIDVAVDALLPPGDALRGKAAIAAAASPTPTGRTTAVSASLPPLAPRRSGCCGPAPLPRPRPNAMCAMSKA